MISNKAILHTMTSMKLAGDAVMKLSRSAGDHANKQNRITKYFEPREECVGVCPCHEDPVEEVYPRERYIGKHTKGCNRGGNRQSRPSINETKKPHEPRIYIPRVMAEMM
jgi:hypothetical protein